MCCFSAPVDSVSRTTIFARSLPDARQILVYQMTLSMKQDLAMILPLPVPAGTAEDAVRWIDLKGYGHFFEHLDSGFPKPRALDVKSGPPTPSAPPAPAPLPVVQVGDFEASFVPTVKDFARLDARFRLPEGTWEALPAVKGFGFAVFKLQKGSKTVHPMAFDFPRAEAAKLFFPTIHIHDGKVHATAHFDHALYAQGREGETHDFMSWQESHAPAARFMTMAQAKDVVDGERHAYLKRLAGRRKNEDVLV